MSDLFIENQNINPKELQDILIGFLGQTYGEISKYDTNIVSPNQFLSPKKYEFQKTAEKILQEATPTMPMRQNNTEHRVEQNFPISVQPNNIPQQIPNDPNQLEFNFDNSITAKTIFNKIEDIEKKIKRIDNYLEKILNILKSYEVEDTQQD